MAIWLLHPQGLILQAASSAIICTPVFSYHDPAWLALRLMEGITRASVSQVGLNRTRPLQQSAQCMEFDAASCP